MRILLTGFTPFGKLEANPSQLVVEQIASRRDPDLITAVLPVEYKRGGEAIRALIQQHRPDAVLMLGMAESRDVINLEWLAANLDDAAKPDNTGTYIFGKKIVSTGPPYYRTTLPLNRFLPLLRLNAVPAVYSYDAGRYLCNHVFYLARHELERTGSAAPCGFVHLPPLRQNEDDRRGLPLETMVAAAGHILDFLRYEEPAPALPDDLAARAQLSEFVGRLIDKPRWALLLGCEGMPLAHCGAPVDFERMAALAAAVEEIGEEVAAGLGNGPFRYALVGGDTGVCCVIALGDNRLLALSFDHPPVLNALLPALQSSNGHVKE